MDNCTTCKYFIHRANYSHCDYNNMMLHKNGNEVMSCYEPMDYDVGKIYQNYDKYIRGKDVY